MSLIRIHSPISAKMIDLRLASHFRYARCMVLAWFLGLGPTLGLWAEENRTVLPKALGKVKSSQALLKVFPDADTDRDGLLSMTEALAYANSHPELKALLTERNRPKNRTPRVTEPGLRSTQSTRGMQLGPRVLVCAHSFMIFTAQQLPSMSEAAGIAYRDAGSQMLGGSRTVEHWMAAGEHNLTKKSLAEGGVDVLLLSPHMILPDEGIDGFAKFGVEKNSELRVLVQASWPGRDGELGEFANSERDQTTLEELDAMKEGFEAAWLRPLEKQVASLNEEIGRSTVSIVPVSHAVFALRKRVAQGTAPGIEKQSDLFRDDLGHPHPPLASLVTYCHFSVIHGRSPVGLPVPPTLQPYPHAEAMNALLQEIAWEAVSTYPMSGLPSRR